MAAPLLLWTVHRFDEKLLPEAEAYYASGRPAPLTRESGYAWVIGFAAPVDRDPPDHALAWSQAAASAAREAKPYPALTGWLEVRAADELLCRPEKMDCVATFSANPRAIDDLAADNRTLMERYARLQAQLDLTDAGTPAAFDAPLPFFRPILGAQAIHLSQLAAQAARGEAAAALAGLEADAAFYRRWLPQSRILLSKMVAVRGLSSDALLAVQVARHAKSLDERAEASLRRIVSPLARDERRVSAGLRFEAVMFPELLDRLLASDRAARKRIGDFNIGWREEIALPFTLRNATLNRHYAMMAAWETIDAAETRDIATLAKSQRERQDAARHPDWRWLYNAGGRASLAEWIPDYESYIQRTRDLDALLRLACAAVEIRLARVPPEGVAAHLATAVPECRDPWEDRPMAWDAGTRTLSFQPRAPGSVARFGGAQGRVAISPY